MEDRNIGFFIPCNSAEDFINKIITDKIPSDLKNRIIQLFYSSVRAEKSFGKICFNNYKFYYKIFVNSNNTFSFVYIIYNSTSDMESSFNNDPYVKEFLEVYKKKRYSH